MSRIRLWSLGVGAAVALTASAGLCSAQSSKAAAARSGRAKATTTTSTTTTAKQDATAKDDPPRGPWNNPAMQLRALRMQVGGGPGGPGGPGGGRGGFGGGRGMTGLLLRSSALQDEIALKEDQKARLKEVGDTADKARRDVFSQMRGRRGGGGDAPGGNGGQFDRASMAEAMTQLAQQSEASVNKILDKAQKDRLNQIELRIIGVTAVARPDVAKKLNLTPPQLAQVQAIVEQMGTAQRELMMAGMTQARAMFGGPGGGGPSGPGGRRGADAGAPANGPAAEPGGTNRGGRRGNGNDGGDAPNGGRGNRPDFNSPEMRERMATMGTAMEKLNGDSAKIEKEAESRIAKILTKKQKERFNSLLGEDFELAKLTQGMNPPGGPGSRTGPARADAGDR